MSEVYAHVTIPVEQFVWRIGTVLICSKALRCLSTSYPMCKHSPTLWSNKKYFKKLNQGLFYNWRDSWLSPTPSKPVSQHVLIKSHWLWSNPTMHILNGGAKQLAVPTTYFYHESIQQSKFSTDHTAAEVGPHHKKDYLSKENYRPV